MKTRLFILAFAVALGALEQAQALAGTAEEVTNTIQALREQGFKTELKDFNFSLPPEIQARANALMATAPGRNSRPFLDHPDLMTVAGNDRALVVWNQDTVKRLEPHWPDNELLMGWDEFRTNIDDQQPEIAAACAAVMSGPIAFQLDASRGNAMLLPHLSVLKHLTETLDDQLMLALHDGDRDAAWTNLLVATRLVTAWNPEPAEISQLVRFANAKLVFGATWQALQANGWPDGQLARLQQEWESASFFTNLSDDFAFKCASDLMEINHDALRAQLPSTQAAVENRPSFDDFIRQALSDPYSSWAELNNRWRREEYAKGGMYEDQIELLLFCHDREVEVRNAVKAPTWLQMRALPGVTNEPDFQLPYPGSRLQMLLNQRRMRQRFERQDSSLLGRAAEAEAERRILVTAIALERYRAAQGSYPPALDALEPVFLGAVPVDFMDGEPLRYRLADDGHFLLYSVGLDGVDNGGKMPVPRERPDPGWINGATTEPQSDIVWPLPASSTEVTAERERELADQKKQLDAAAERGRVAAEEAETNRQEAIKRLMALKPPFNTSDPDIEGKHLSRVIQNSQAARTKKVSLDELLTLQQVGSGDEVTYEVPVSYDAVKKIGELRLRVDDGMGEELEECDRATNGDCLLVWNTTYEPPGQHVVQAELLGGGFLDDGQELDIKGPVTPFLSTNLLQFFEGSSMFTDKGATLYAKIPELRGTYSIELQTPGKKHLITFKGTTTNGIIDVEWNLMDDRGNKFTNDSFNSVFNVTLPDSGRSQTVGGP
ncbi:MAG: hypothetical protein ABSE48_13960 [Verrucomicrobiota bacterium]